MKSGSLKILEPSGPLQAYNGIASFLNSVLLTQIIKGICVILRVEIDYFTKQNQQAGRSNGNRTSFVSVRIWNLSIIEMTVRFGMMEIVRKSDTSRLCITLKLDNC